MNDELILFQSNDFVNKKYVPLAARMRPRKISEVCGQKHILGVDSLLPRLIKNNTFGSIILYGPPGCGKTSLAEVIANETGAKFVKVNAVLSNVAELRQIISDARIHDGDVIVFIDEIHRFNKSQQDLLLPDVENGNIRLIGATTHNPGFYIINPLLSRSHLFKLEPLSCEDILPVLRRAIADREFGLGRTQCKVSDDVLSNLAKMADGDLRRALNFLETLVSGVSIGSNININDLKQFAAERQYRYDSDEDDHYDTISAYIKSMRGCDPDSATYWLAKMLRGGEDPRFIARRLIIFASEDVGLADSRALPLAMSCFDACEKIGMPECRINLVHVTVFMALAPKSNSAYLALGAAYNSIDAHGAQTVPKQLRDANGVANQRDGNGVDYLYSHDFVDNISGQKYMDKPEQFYFPKPSDVKKR